MNMSEPKWHDQSWTWWRLTGLDCALRSGHGAVGYKESRAWGTSWKPLRAVGMDRGRPLIGKGLYAKLSKRHISCPKAICKFERIKNSLLASPSQPGFLQCPSIRVHVRRLKPHRLFPVLCKGYLRAQLGKWRVEQGEGERTPWPTY